MQKKQLLSAMAVIAFASSAVADDEINYSFSLKDWNHTFKQNKTSSQTNAPVLSATVKKGEYFVTASFLLPATYNFAGDSLNRKDSDLAVGWSLNPNLSLLGGYKVVNSYSYTSNKFDGNVDFKITYIGLNGFTSLNENSFLYGTFTRSLNVNKSNAASTDHKVVFTNYEAGYGYILDKNVQLSVGYRSQSFDDTSSPKPELAGIIFGVTLTR